MHRILTTFFLVLGLTSFSQGNPAKTIVIHGQGMSVITGALRHDGKHIDAVGVVYDIQGQNASVGTGTYIGNRHILTAGHVLYNVLPKSVSQTSGPVTIDVSDKKVFWSNGPELNFTSMAGDVYRVTHVTVDAEFINNLAGNMVKPDQNDVKCDMAVLTLEKNVSGINQVEIPGKLSAFPQEGLLVGYGRNSLERHAKRAHAQALHGIMDVGEWSILMSNLNEDMNNNPLSKDPDKDQKLELLFGKKRLGHEDVRISRATQGDSGGPLLVVSDSGRVEIIGIMSANSEAFNAFSSLISRSQEGFVRNPKLDALLKAAR